MKIVDHKTFLSMPAGTVYSKYEPCIFEPFCIKGKSISYGDFFYQTIVDSVKCRGSDEFHGLLDDSEKNGTTFPLDFDSQGRDGCFEVDQLFAVWDDSDVEALIARLQNRKGE